MDRKRLEELAGIFSISVGEFAILDNHLHVLARLDPDVAAAWLEEFERKGYSAASSRPAARD